MPVIDLQRRLVQVGRIRMGERNARGLPTRLETWKLTSRDRFRLDAAAQAFGGTVEEWEGHEGQYALITETDALPILLLPGQTMSSWYELWSGGGCKRRCDGETEQLTDGPCLCDPEQRECKPHTRLNVLLPDVPGIGCWRLDSAGYYAAIELGGTVDLLELATARGALLPARLRIDQRVQIREGLTKRFPVPTLDIDVRPLEMIAITRPPGGGGELAAAPVGYSPIARPALAAGNGVSVAEGLAAAEKLAAPQTRTARSAAPIGDAESFEGEQPIPVPDSEPQLAPDPSIASDSQQRLIRARAHYCGLDDEERHEITRRITGQPSSKLVPKDLVDVLLREFERLYEERQAAQPPPPTPTPRPDPQPSAVVSSGEQAMNDFVVEPLVTRLEELATTLDELDPQLKALSLTRQAVQANRSTVPIHEHINWLGRQIELAEAAVADRESQRPEGGGEQGSFFENRWHEAEERKAEGRGA